MGHQRVALDPSCESFLSLGVVEPAIVKLPYKEGTVFSVPLRDHGFGIGLVARSPKKGKVILCYFFGPRREFPPNNVADLGAISPSQAVLIHFVGDLGLIRGKWPIVGELSSWDHAKWPIPPFKRTDPILGHLSRVHHSDNDPFEVVHEEPEPANSRLENQGSLGYVAAELALTLRLNQLTRSE